MVRAFDGGGDEFLKETAGVLPTLPADFGLAPEGAAGARSEARWRLSVASSEVQKIRSYQLFAGCVAL